MARFLSISLLLCVPITTGAATITDVIDFESGFIDREFVTQITTATNTVQFHVGSSPQQTTPGAYIAVVGGDRTAFVPNDTPANGSGGAFFLTDESDGPSAAFDYFLTFQTPISQLSVDVLDYRGDSVASPGDVVELIGYTDVIGGNIAQIASYTIPRPRPVDGNSITLSILSSSPIAAAQIRFGAADIGTGIDNLQFANAVPEPTGWVLACLALGIGGLRRPGRRRS